jgi:hypothetical protein
MQFPPTGPRSGVLAGYHDIPGRAPEELYAPWDRIQTLLSPDEKRRQDLPPEKQNECKWADQSSSSEVVWPWTKQELARLMRFSTRKGSPDETDLGQTFLNFSPKKKDGEEESRAEEKVAPPKHPEAKTTKPEEEETPAKEDSDKKEGRTQLPQRRIGR